MSASAHASIHWPTVPVPLVQSMTALWNNNCVKAKKGEHNDSDCNTLIRKSAFVEAFYHHSPAAARGSMHCSSPCCVSRKNSPLCFLFYGAHSHKAVFIKRIHCGEPAPFAHVLIVPGWMRKDCSLEKSALSSPLNHANSHAQSSSAARADMTLVCELLKALETLKLLYVTFKWQGNGVVCNRLTWYFKCFMGIFGAFFVLPLSWHSK